MSRLSRRSLLARVLTAAAALPLLVSRSQAQGAAHQVVIQGMAFNPPSLSIAAGDTVVFTNQDAAPHTATSDDGLFDTGRLSQGQSAQLTFSAAGTYPYYCAIHPSMRGTITVA